MNQKEHLIERHILQYQARLHHIDELVDRVEKGDNLRDAAELCDELTQIRIEREALLEDIQALKDKTREEWQENTIEEAGPMIIWEAVAKKLEGLIKRVNH